MKGFLVVCAVSLFGCSMISPREQTAKPAVSQVHVGGDVTVSAINRKGF